MRFLGLVPNSSIRRSVLPLAAVLVLGIPALSQAGVNLKSLQGGGWSRPAFNQGPAFAQRPQFTQRPQFQPLNNTAFQNVFIPPKQNFQPSFRPPVAQQIPIQQQVLRSNVYARPNAVSAYIPRQQSPPPAQVPTAVKIPPFRPGPPNNTSHVINSPPVHGQTSPATTMPIRPTHSSSPPAFKPQGVASTTHPASKHTPTSTGVSPQAARPTWTGPPIRPSHASQSIDAHLHQANIQAKTVGHQGASTHAHANTKTQVADQHSRPLPGSSNSHPGSGLQKTAHPSTVGGGIASTTPKVVKTSPYPTGTHDPATHNGTSAGHLAAKTTQKQGTLAHAQHAATGGLNLKSATLAASKGNGQNSHHTNTHNESVIVNHTNATPIHHSINDHLTASKHPATGTMTAQKTKSLASTNSSIAVNHSSASTISKASVRPGSTTQPSSVVSTIRPGSPVGTTSVPSNQSRPSVTPTNTATSSGTTSSLGLVAVATTQNKANVGTTVSDRNYTGGGLGLISIGDVQNAVGNYVSPITQPVNKVIQPLEGGKAAQAATNIAGAIVKGAKSVASAGGSTATFTGSNASVITRPILLPPSKAVNGLSKALPAKPNFSNPSTLVPGLGTFAKTINPPILTNPSPKISGKVIKNTENALGKGLAQAGQIGEQIVIGIAKGLASSGSNPNGAGGYGDGEPNQGQEGYFDSNGDFQEGTPPPSDGGDPPPVSDPGAGQVPSDPPATLPDNPPSATGADGPMGPPAFVGPPADAAQSNNNQIDFSFIYEQEDHANPTGTLYTYNPNSGNSGVTIASGVDLNQHPVDTLDVPQDLQTLLAPYSGPNGLEYLAQNGPVNITQTQADELNAAVAPLIINPLIQAYNAASSVPFNQLPPDAQTAIADVAYQYGPDLATATPDFWEQVTHQDWQAAVNNLNDFHDNYGSRRQAEANSLQTCVTPTAQGGGNAAAK